MAETYTSTFANGAAVDAALTLATTAIQPEDIATPSSDGLLTKENKAQLDLMISLMFGAL